jgi:Periplasmic copper-binding protein (NosD)
VAAVSAGLTMVLAAGPAGAAGPYVVNATDDAPDLNTRDGLCLTSAGRCTLRAALQQDQADGGPSTIRFNIAGGGPHTIQIGGVLPTLAAGGTTIDGYTEPGSSPNTSARASNAVLRVEVRGNGAGGSEALVVTSANNTIRGLALFNHRVTIRIAGAGASGNVVAGNFLGTNAAASFQASGANANAAGVIIRTNAASNRVGGTSAADRNVISGNAGRGVMVNVPNEVAGGTAQTLITGNIIGLTPSGSAQRANLGHAVDMNSGANRTRVVDNVISGNSGSAVEVSHGTTTADNVIEDNRIGTDLTGASSPGYARNGSSGHPNIRVEDGADDTVVQDNVIGGAANGGIKVNAISRPALGTRIVDNLIGVSTTGANIGNGPFGVQVEGGSADTEIAGNTIAFNAVGVRVVGDTTDRVTISENSMFGNTNLGIDLLPAGVTPNDSGDGDEGPNNLLNVPVLEFVDPSEVRARACGRCRIEVFLADTEASGQSGEGRELVVSGTTNSSGVVTLDLPSGARDRAITATATDGSGNTSEFARNIGSTK